MSLRRLLACALAVAGAACDSGGSFTTRVASDFAPMGHSVSVLGLYKEGRMSSDAWQDLAPYFATALASASCDAGYPALLPSNPDLAVAIDQFARDEGPSDDLLVQIAPAAKGELILVVTMAGKVPAGDAGATRPSGPSPAGARRRRGRGASRRPLHDANVLDLSASLYSVGQQRSVALVAMQYAGPSLDDAMKQFADRIARIFPESRCAGWDWGARVDAAKLRQSRTTRPRQPARAIRGHALFVPDTRGAGPAQGPRDPNSCTQERPNSSAS